MHFQVNMDTDKLLTDLLKTEWISNLCNPKLIIAKLILLDVFFNWPTKEGQLKQGLKLTFFEGAILTFLG